MRLSKIKLAGFKSFVDPTTIVFNSNLNGVVGPNGCGKSNVIDAVRWVMGESSAKYLRGQSMDDVIFKGSSERKPVGQATVELIFDNSGECSKKLGGEYAQYNEIAIKRLVSREGTSKYFLNGTRCRRRDITDIFLGTGLGPRSYAIIEQGMISRLIDAKPEELRIYLEEAAGISKYRQRRKETETRIHSTRDNLDRLLDLRDEVEKHINQLERQVKAANQYTAWRNEQSKTEAQLIAYKLNHVNEQIQQQEVLISQQGNRQQATLSQLRETELAIEQAREKWHAAQAEVESIQETVYALGAETSTLEAQIKHYTERRNNLEEQYQQLTATYQLEQMHHDESLLQFNELKQQIDTLTPHLEELDDQIDEAEEKLAFSQAHCDTLNTHYEQLQAELSHPMRDTQVEKTRMDQLERQLIQLKQRQSKLSHALEQAQLVDNTAQLNDIAEHLDSINLNEQNAKQKVKQLEADNQTREQEQQQLNNTIDSLRTEEQQLKGRLASLTTLQQAQLKQETTQQQHALEALGLVNKKQLIDQLKVISNDSLNASFNPAFMLEIALDSLLQAYIVDTQNDFKHYSHYAGDLLKNHALMILPSSTILIESPTRLSNNLPNTLIHLSTLVKEPQKIRSLLTHFYACDNEQTALQYHTQLAPHEIIITAQGALYGSQWYQSPKANQANEGLIERKKHIEQTDIRLQAINKQLTSKNEAFQHNADYLLASKQHLQQCQHIINQSIQQRSEYKNQQNTLKAQQQHSIERQAELLDELEIIAEQVISLQEEHNKAFELRTEALEKLEQLNETKERLTIERNEYQAMCQDDRAHFEALSAEKREQRIRLEALKTQKTDKQQQIDHQQQQLETLKEKHLHLAEQLDESDNPTDKLTIALQTSLEQSNQAMIQLTESRQIQTAIDHDIHTQETNKQTINHQLEQVRQQLEQMKLDWKETCVNEKNLQQQLLETDYKLDDFISLLLSSDLKESDYIQSIETLKKKIKRLGAINLAAVDEYKEEKERKTYLDTQHDDLSQALDTLEGAIKKIDKETRLRFSNTFNAINDKVKTMFPKLFGGGEAYLSLTDNDLLTSGVMIMARPPGKRISTIQLMSGGEKALTAATLVFAIFELNPSPFCMLDEVDAPLDEANVGRFCQLVKQMSETVQFIFITHNRATMELSDNLIGVTMRELGVSRTVSVNVAEASKMIE